MYEEGVFVYRSNHYHTHAAPGQLFQFLAHAYCMPKQPAECVNIIRGSFEKIFKAMTYDEYDPQNFTSQSESRNMRTELKLNGAQRC